MANITDQEIRHAAQNDDAMTALVRKYHLFIIRVSSATSRKFVTKHDDEYAIALKAFCDAVKTYDPAEGVAFEAYAKLLIKNRVIDYLRSEARHKGQVSLEEEMENGRDVANDDERAQEAMQSDAAFEIARLSQIIKPYGIAFSDLPEVSPKHQKTREDCAAAVVFLLKNPPLVAEMRKTRGLPIKILHESCGIPRKTLERHRKYIVTATEVCLGDFPVIAEYLKHMISAARSVE